MRKMLCEIDLEKAQGYPGRYLEHFSKMNRAPAYAECRELVAKLGLIKPPCPPGSVPDDDKIPDPEVTAKIMQACLVRAGIYFGSIPAYPVTTRNPLQSERSQTTTPWGRPVIGTWESFN